MPGVSLRHKYSAVPWRMSRQNAGFSGGGGSNFLKQVKNKGQREEYIKVIEDLFEI